MITNAKEFPKVFYCRHMVPGIARYENLNPETKKIDEEYLWIDADALKQSAASFVGKPVYVHHQKVDLANIQDADGFVSDCFYNELDGWLWAKFLAVSDAAQNAIARKWSISNAYIPEDWEGGGTHLNVDYDKKIRKHNFTHLAIVPNPRYEEAKIYTPEEFKAYQADKRSELDELQNSKPNKGHPMFRFFEKKDEELKNGIPADADISKIEIEVNGKRVALSEIANAVSGDKKVTIEEAITLYNAKKNEDEKEEKEKKEKENKKAKWNDDTEVSVGDEKMPMKDLMNKMGYCQKMNADEEEEEKKKKKEKEEKENAEKEAKEKLEKEEKENSAKRMKEMLNAHNKPVSAVVTSMDKLKLGKSKYGSAKK